MKTKLAWPVWNENGNGTRAMTTTKNEVLLGYHMKIVVVFLFGGGGEGVGRDKNLVGTFFLVEEDYPKLALIMEFK